MELWLTHLITQSLTYSLSIVVLISFLESLAIIGLFLPGIVLMSMLGTLIGNGQLSLYSAWIASSIGCLLGDWLSYYIGWKCKDWISNLKILKKHIKIVNNIKHALYKYNMFTILIGRFIGPTRPLVPMVSGMLKLPLKKFIFPNLIGCLIWPALYFSPGIFVGMIVTATKSNPQHDNFKLLIYFTIISFLLSIWMTWKWWHMKNKKNTTKINLIIYSIKLDTCVKYITITSYLITMINLIAIFLHLKETILKNICNHMFI